MKVRVTVTRPNRPEDAMIHLSGVGSIQNRHSKTLDLTEKQVASLKVTAGVTVSEVTEAKSEEGGES